MTSISELVCPICSSNKLVSEPKLTFDSYPGEIEIKCYSCGHAFPESAGVLSTNVRTIKERETHEE